MTSTARRTIAPPKISAVAKSMESGVHASVGSSSEPASSFPSPPLFLLPSLKTRIAFYRPGEFTPSRSLLADETRKITRNHANLIENARFFPFRLISFLSFGFVISSPSILSPRRMTTRASRNRNRFDRIEPTTIITGGIKN